MHPRTESDLALLVRLIGREAAYTHYRGSLARLFACAESEDDLTILLIAREIVTRWLHEEVKHRALFEGPAVLKEFLATNFAGQPYESFVVMYLDTQHRLIEVEELFRGTLTQTAVYPREVVKRSLHFNAASVVLSHNHPSGVAEPSRADEHLTTTLRQALAIVDVRVLDHIVVGGGRTVSFAERGML